MSLPANEGLMRQAGKPTRFACRDLDMQWSKERGRSVQEHDLKDEIDFRDLIRKPDKLFGYAFLYFVGAILLLGMLYLWNINTVGSNAIAPVALKDSSAFIQDIPLQTPVVLPPVDIRTAGHPSDSLVALGRELFRANCVSCHGDNGMGDGPSAAMQNPKPRNFHSLAGWTSGSKVSQIYRTLEEGVPGTGMSSYNYMPPGSRLALAHFIRTFAPGQPEDTAEELQALETTYRLSEGKVVPGQIPVKKAMGIVLREDKTDMLRAEELAQRFLDDAAPGAQLLREVAGNLETVAVTSLRRGAAFSGLEEFVRGVTADPQLNGFSPAIDRLRGNEWTLIHEYLDTAVARARSGG